MKILYFGNSFPSAIGIINLDIKAVIDRKYPEVQFDLLNWGIPEDAQLFFNQKVWKNYDILIVDPYIVRQTEMPMWTFDTEDCELFKSKLIPIYHHEVDVPSDHFSHGWFDEWFTTPVCGINPYIVNQIRERGVNSTVLPIGVSVEKFKPFKEVKKIKKIGFVGNAYHSENEGWKSIKRPELFKEICDKAGIEPVIITNREHGWKIRGQYQGLCK